MTFDGDLFWRARRTPRFDVFLGVLVCLSQEIMSQAVASTGVGRKTDNRCSLQRANLHTPQLCGGKGRMH
jgi:hypothetical protein